VKEHEFKSQGILESLKGPFEKFSCGCGATVSQYSKLEKDDLLGEVTRITCYYFNTKSSAYCDEKEVKWNLKL
jgi:hypothetical protein